ncbi:hypothetical protein K0M31_018845 [Melipona bicolor]|uniref:Uncharacterized protein n=1 Tax=Melipona bicolor TaxID=60889 RepID=A0AA40KSB5_9HYME|nr:hypothetical protein K0M31_018845 [Melipona bicolor]
MDESIYFTNSKSFGKCKIQFGRADRLLTKRFEASSCTNFSKSEKDQKDPNDCVTDSKDIRSVGAMWPAIPQIRGGTINNDENGRTKWQSKTSPTVSPVRVKYATDQFDADR